MHASGKVFQTLVALALASTALVAHAFAEDCGFLQNAGQARLQPGDRKLYYQFPGSPGWAELNGPVQDLNGQRVQFAYAIVEDFAEPRAGVLLIKSGYLRRVGDPSAAGRTARQVKLRRAADGSFGNGTCAAVAPFGKGAISAKSYDDYHDQGLNVRELKTISAFHFEYAARRGCRRTNDTSVDSIAPPDMRSNLSQFSFDREVVARGTYSQVLAWFRPTRAYASSDNLADQRVELRQYRTVPSQAVCIRFKLAVRGPASFLRINDLEAQSQNGLRYVRSDEQEWTLSP